MTDNSSVILEKRGQAFWITINRPDKRNALNGEVVSGIARAFHGSAQVCCPSCRTGNSVLECRPDHMTGSLCIEAAFV